VRRSFIAVTACVVLTLAACGDDDPSEGGGQETTDETNDEPTPPQDLATTDLAEVEVVGDDLGGMAVHIGARVAASAEAGEVLVSSTVRDLVVGSGIAFTERGVHALRGVPGEWRLFAASV